ncbi:46 kDa FK506-binding nuclear protein isoform X2 [Phymastichus coffea]|uniref:46 kDa FK506-binding nuclear protein isoform X2 n=1 Tax=Phymastichus coffea TaxID=108790 RepID=UPI00273B7B14|nr:46 kDa FK506-binding nuclear protein isoform X2 [Phymastichus coffea]
MFWGLIMEPNKRYTQTVETGFHLSMASLDASTASNSLVQVMLCYDHRNYLLCTLKRDSIWQVPLDLNFQEGTKISFTCNGEGHVHLTGYLMPVDEDLDDFDEEEMEEEIPELVEIGKKRKSDNSPKNKNEKKAKKSVIEDEGDIESGDSDDDNNGTIGSEDSDDDHDDDDDDDNDDDDGEKDDNESDEDGEEEPVSVSVQQSKKQKQKESQQNHSQQNQSKKEKNKIVNGKDLKNEKEQGGVQVEDLKQGGGAPAKPGKFVSVYYIGRLKNGKKFDQTTQGEGFKFRLGKGEVIKGWDVGITGMKVGGKRKIIIPPNMGYGAKGSPPIIPPNSELTFEVELKAVN